MQEVAGSSPASSIDEAAIGRPGLYPPVATRALADRPGPHGSDLRYG
jgi:hypothetical protein